MQSGDTSVKQSTTKPCLHTAFVYGRVTRWAAGGPAHSKCSSTAWSGCRPSSRSEAASRPGSKSSGAQRRRRSGSRLMRSPRRSGFRLQPCCHSHSVLHVQKCSLAALHHCPPPPGSGETRGYQSCRVRVTIWPTQFGLIFDRFH